ncbi:MAG: hypothetical protein QME66_02290 [Candidatus Eisenbacteria bacterium]|nr:hypothetical protein [Candidatus Eisenbacteria bacterium]
MFYDEVFRILNKKRVRYVVAGGMAVVLHGFARFTADLGIILHLEERNIDRFFDALHELGYNPQVPVTREQFKDRTSRAEWISRKGMVVFSFLHPREHLKAIDVFIEEPMTFGTLAKNAKRIRVEDLSIPVISLRHLMRLKKKAGRPQDAIDLANLKEIQKLTKR